MDIVNRWMDTRFTALTDPFCAVTDVNLQEVERLTEPGCLLWEEKDVWGLRLPVSEINDFSRKNEELGWLPLPVCNALICLRSSHMLYVINTYTLKKAQCNEQPHAKQINYDIDLAVTSETPLKQSHEMEMFTIKIYQMHVSKRQNRWKGGGIAVCV